MQSASSDPTFGLAPHGVTLDRYATLSAELAEGDHTLTELLAKHGLTREHWVVASTVWQRALAEEALEGGTAIGDAYATAFVRAQDALKPVPQLTPEEWAALTFEIASQDPVSPLASRRLRAADHARLSRRWAKILSSGQTETDRYFAAFYAMQRAAAAKTPGR